MTLELQQYGDAITFVLLKKLKRWLNGPVLSEDRPLSELLSFALFLASVLIYAWKAGRNTGGFAATLTVLGLFVVLNITLFCQRLFYWRWY
ncbi:hypothetical protein ACP0HM_28470 [Escherichia coli]